MKRCPHCGKQVRDEIVKCFYCNKLVDQLSQPQEESGGIWGKNKDIIILLIIVVGCGIAFIKSNIKNEKKEVGYITANAEKGSPVDKSSEKNKEDLDNHEKQGTVSEVRQPQAESETVQKMEQEKQREKQRIELEQQRKQELVSREIQPVKSGMNNKK